VSEHAATAGHGARGVARQRAGRRRHDLALDGIGIAGLVGFALLTVILWGRVTPFFDPPIRDALLQYSSWHDLWNDISEAANFPMIGIGVGIVLFLFWRGRRREAILVIVTLALVTAGSEAVKQLVHRPRPPGSETVVPGVIYSFPSGHMLEAVTILGIVALLVWRSRTARRGAIAVAVAVALFCAAVGVARIAINAHWPSDVLAGFLGGIGVLALVTRVTRQESAGRDDDTDGQGRPVSADSSPSAAAADG
jgi:membrane-associated phospholipid phosphatase